MKLLKAASVFAMLLMPLPLFLCADFYASQGLSILHLFIFYDIGIMLLFIARFFGISLKNSRQKKALKFSAAVTGGVLCTAALVSGYLLFPNSLSGMLLGLAAVFFYIYGWQLGKFPPQKVFGTVWLGVFTCVSLLCYILFVCNAQDLTLEVGKIVTLICFATVFSIAAWNKNQENVSRQLERRSSDNLPLQSRIRRYNAGLTLVFCTAFCGLILLAGTIASVFNGWLKVFVVMLVNALSSAGKVAPPEQVAEETLPDGTELVFSQSKVGMILTTILQALAVVALITAIVFAIRLIIRKINNALERKNEVSDENKESYIDYLEEQRPALNKQNMSIKKLYRRYRKEKSSDEKLRLGYKIFLLHLKNNGDENTTFETTKQHLEYAQLLGGDKFKLDEFSSSYSAFRYDDMKPSENEMQRLDELIKQLAT